MRKLLFAAAALALAGPALAQPAPADEKIVRNLPAAQEIEEMGDALGRVAEAVMKVKVGPIAEAIDPGRRMSRRDRDRTLGDVAGGDDPYVRERVRDSIGAVAVGLGGMMEQLAILAPVIRHSLEDAERRIGDAMRDRRLSREADIVRERDRADGIRDDDTTPVD